MTGNPAIPVPPPAFRYRPKRLAYQLSRQAAVKIVCIGSSTTAGEGGITPYPQRLQGALLARFPSRTITALNRGNGGEEAPAELARMQTDVIDENPTMVIWQVGTNAVWNGDPLGPVEDAIKSGLALLRDNNMDIVLMDLQYVPAVLTPGRAEAAADMVDIIARAAEGCGADVNVFQRFTYMKAWRDVERISFDRILDPGDLNRLHHSDWSIQRITDALCQVMLNALSIPDPPATS